MDLERARGLLLEAEEPPHWEAPPGFDRTAALARLRTLRETIEARCGCACGVDDDFQDSACFAALIFDETMLAGPREAKPIHPRLDRLLAPQLRVSSFGRLAVVVHEDALKPQARTAVHASIDQAGFVLIPLDALAEPYTGAMKDHTNRPVRDTDPTATWFWRYFDYL